MGTCLKPRVLKNGLMVCSLIQACIGIAVITASLTMQKFYSSYIPFLNEIFPSPLILFVFGSVILTIALLTILSTIHNSFCMITGLSLIWSAVIVLIGIVFALDFLVGIANFAMREEEAIDGLISIEAVEGMQYYGKPYTEELTMSWDMLQRQFHCCGYNNHTDWTAYYRPHRENMTVTAAVPDSCCRREKNGCGINYDTAGVHTNGCREELIKLVVKTVVMFGGCGIIMFPSTIITVVYAHYYGKFLDTARFSLT